MDLNKNLKIKTILLSAVLFSQTALSGVTASDTPPMYDISPSPPPVSESSEHTAEQYSTKRQRTENEKQSVEKSVEAAKEQSPKKTERVSEAVFLNASFPIDSTEMCVCPAEPPSDLLCSLPDGQHNEYTRLNPDYIDSAFDPQSPFCILPDFSKKAKKTPHPFIVPGMAVSTEATQKRLSRRDITPRCFREETQPDEGQEEPTPETDSTAEKLLDIIYVPEAQIYCIGLPAPILVININSNFKSELSDEEFNALAERELKEWVELCHICKKATVIDRLANVEMVLCHQKVFASVRKVFNLKDWSTTSCKPLGLNSTFSFNDSYTYRSEPHYLDRTNLVISHRSSRISDKCYDLSSLFTVLRYFIEFPEFIRIGNLLHHPLFKDKELTDEIDKISALYSFNCDKKYLLDYFTSGCVLRKITHNTYSDPTLIKMQDCFKCAAVTQDIDSLMHGIGYFNLVRALNSLPFVKDRPRYKGELPECAKDF